MKRLLSALLLTCAVAASAPVPATAQTYDSGITSAEWLHYKYQGSAPECNVTIGDVSLQYDVLMLDGAMAFIAVLGVKDNDARIKRGQKPITTLPIGTPVVIAASGAEHTALVAKREGGKTFFATDLQFLSAWWFDDTQNLSVWLTADRSIHGDRILASGENSAKDRVKISQSLRCFEDSMI